ncbi:SpaH/EbpB family LPXTG-anchored major pilin [Eubacterium barkeri]|uniref:LPXTG-motif cell wall anchor domain-containing protein/fimbrial isopeptide formation D2 domain-containing protein n=1 Tax=Eubacterium barkeri TaxID=1528 RepID=A0A1H3ESU9_EUBBA|nr:SpaH/EbpB family LPXTG-anchored major pilin [Eubacterium barkeri]SDX81715.1 LPXTG-motif cell wall anchor domain-containing protein/fimbrial isopeptide formation D2 domain-containing protein [Eubacterium barkeri]
MERKFRFTIIPVAITFFILILLSYLPVLGAAASPPSTIDDSMKGRCSMTITKYGGDGYTPSNAAPGTLTGTTADAPTGGDPLANVIFTTQKVADLVQEDNALQYKVTSSDFANWAGAGITVGEVYPSATLQALINGKKAGDLQDISNWTGHIDSEPTNANGQTAFSNLDFGLYIVVETDYPSNVTQNALPVLISLPMSNQNGDGWLYQISLYPKNTTALTELDKRILTDHGITKNYAVSIGDTINYEVPFTAIVPAEGLISLTIRDTPDMALNLDPQSVKVYRGHGDGKTELTRDTDYSVTSDGGKLAIDLKSTHLNTLTAGTQDYTVTYTGVLNDQAVMGQKGHTNTVAFDYVKKGDPPTKVTTVNLDDAHPSPKVYTYGIQLSKLGDNGAKLQDVTFTCHRDGQPTMTFYHNLSGAYSPSTAAGAQESLSTNANGQINIRGLAPGTYYLTETKTNTGYQLLKNPVKVEIIPVENSLSGAVTAKVSDKAVTMLDEGGDNTTALVPLTIQNNRGFNMPATGSAGTITMVLLGITLVAGATILLIIWKKKQV